MNSIITGAGKIKEAARGVRVSLQLRCPRQIQKDEKDN